MGIFFLILIAVLTVAGSVGLVMEIRFWHAQRDSLSVLDAAMQVNPDPVDLKLALDSLSVSFDHPLRAALDRVLATGSSPEAALDLIELREPHERFLSAARRYAIAVLLLCGIAGTLFSLHSALPTSGLSTAFDSQGQLDPVKYGEAFKKLQPALGNAFWPSICGILATLFLQAGRYGFLLPAQQATERQLVLVACNWLIPWKQRHEEVTTAATAAAASFEAAAASIFAAAQAGADSVNVAAEQATASLTSLGATLVFGCEKFNQSFEAASANIVKASNGAIASVQSTARQASDSLSSLGTALTPVAAAMSAAVQCIEKSGQTLQSATTRFDTSVAANGPFLRALQQLYDAVSPAEARYERLLVAVGELQKLSTSQNVEIARVCQQTASLAKAALQTADESTRLAQSLQTAAAGFPSVSQSVKDHHGAMVRVADAWQKAASTLASEFSTFRAAVSAQQTTQGNAVANLFHELPVSVAGALTLRLPTELEPLRETVVESQASIGGLQESLRTLEDAVQALRSDLQATPFSSAPGVTIPARVRPKKKWWRLWMG